MKQLLFALFILTSTIASAQLSTIEIVAGNNFNFLERATFATEESKYFATANPDYKQRSNFVLGVNLTHKLNNEFAFKTGLRYSEVGFYHHEYNWGCFGGLAPSYSDNYTRSKYIELPLMVRANFNPENNFSIFYEFGASFSYLLNQTFEDTEGKSNRFNDAPFTEISTPRLYVPIKIAVGPQYKIENKVIFAQIIGELGMMPEPTNTTIIATHLGMGIEFGVRFNLPHKV